MAAEWKWRVEYALMRWLRPPKELLCTVFFVHLILIYNVYYNSHLVIRQTCCLVCLSPYKLASTYMCSMCVCACLRAVPRPVFPSRAFSFPFSRSQTEQGHCLRGMFEKCSSAVGKKKYERDPKSRHRAPWIMSAAELKKRDETICSGIGMPNWLSGVDTSWRSVKKLWRLALLLAT